MCRVFEHQKIILYICQMNKIFTSLGKFHASNFYHPCRFKMDSDHVEGMNCRLAYFVGLFRKYGFLYAKLDPLLLYNKQYEEFARPIDVGISYQTELTQFQYRTSPVILASRNIEELEKNLIRTYLNTTAVEFSHVGNMEEEEWLYQNYEKYMLGNLEPEKRVRIARDLVRHEALDLFLHKKFVTFKRYSGEGAESTVIALEELFQLAAEDGFEHVVFGMPHRGRFNTLVNALDYPASHLFHKINGKTDTPMEVPNIIDDVTSHIGQSIEKDYNGHKTKITLVNNPSHLEAQNPVSMGKTRSKQHLHGADKVLNIQVHGDAAFCAQGIVFESLLLGKVPKFNIDGTIHLITNNQIGYTTKPIDGRPSKNPSDVAKAFNIPIIHVNSENIQDVVKVMKLCMEYKKKFKKDILVDLVCYRKYGHNEVDEPEFTQPQMYGKIRKTHLPSPKRYSDLLAEENLIGKDFYEETKKKYFQEKEVEYQKMTAMKNVTLAEYTNPNREGAKAFTEQWQNCKPSIYGEEFSTGVDTNLLKEFSNASTYIPNNFTLHARIKRYHIEERIKSIEKNKLNWATCQNLALFTLNYEGHNIRFSGQDVQRGTFSQRHMNLTDQKTEEEFNPLVFFADQNPGRGKVEIFNSPLTENACMSYEYGYSIDHPNNMTIWEAQFGDFFNTAQVVIDTYLTNSENKWLRQTGLVLVLPHGFDGAGPEHSSCRIERFLQLANSNGGIFDHQLKDRSSVGNVNMKDPIFYQDIKEANFSLAFPTKPANIFHLLRRQMKRNFRKPLIVAGPKALLRNPSCTSTFQEMGPNTQFEEVLPYCNSESLQNNEVIIFCSGKFVYDIVAKIQQKKAEKTGLFAIEELFPFPEKKVSDLLSKCNKNVKVYWCQQENVNGGAFYFVERRIARVIKNLGIDSQVNYVGRKAISATAVGSVEMHKKETAELGEWIKQILI